MNATLKRNFQRIVALLCSAALVAWFVHSGKADNLAVLMARVQPLQLAGLIGAFVVTYLLRAGRVFDEFRVDTPVTFPGILRLTLVHNAMVNVVPFRGGEAAFPILLSRWFGVPTTRAVAALLWLRLQDAFVVLALAAFVWPGLPLWLRVAWIAAVLLAAWAIPAWARNHPELLPEHGRFARLSIKLRAALAQSTRSSGRAWLWTFANWSVKLAAQAWMLALLLGVSLQAGLAGAMGLELAAVQPIQGVAGFGTAEFGGAALLRAHGIMLADGVQAALVLHLFVIACALCAGAAALIFLPDANKNLPAQELSREPTET
ncbi:MAG TPA: lysylphosphatidylglycerol synthase transmembrane domain-containing protein [Rhodocyclaceae bacterium]|nr:lysylphosphatidylglycerol synthase transmembrane domain-containing protein [Rhodocyclaceae bacterium]